MEHFVPVVGGRVKEVNLVGSVFFLGEVFRTQGISREHTESRYDDDEGDDADDDDNLKIGCT